MKKLLGLFLSVVMLLTMISALPFYSFAQDIEDDDPTELFSFTETDGYITITGFKKKSDYNYYTVNIPGTINGLPVQAIGDRAFAGAAYLASIGVPHTVLSVGNMAFLGCSALEQLSMGSPEIQTFGNAVFANCTALTSFTFPASLTSIGSEIFMGCENLEEINVEEGNTAFASVDGVLFNADQSVLLKMPPRFAQTAYTVPATVQTVAADAIYNLSKYAKLKTLYLPSSLAEVEESAVNSNETLEEIIYFGSEEDWSKVSVGDDNGELQTKITFHSEHTLGDDKVSVEPSCTEAGSESGTCTFCGQYVTIPIPAKGHTPGAPVRENEKAATCAAEGCYDEVVYCSVCNAEISRETKTIDKIAHTPGEAVTENEIPATCAAEGSYDEVVYCSVCNAEISRETKTIDKIAHTPGEAVTENEIPATCTAEGSYDEVVYCSVCHEELSREPKTTEKIAHSYEPVTTPPTCTEQGYTTYTCSVCRDTYVDDYIDELDHDWNDWTESSEPVPSTCVTQGMNGGEVRTCARCGKQDTRGGDPLPLNPDNHEKAVTDEAVPATCTATGLTEGSHCEACKTVIVPQTIVEKLAHTPAEAVKENETPATCTAEGSYDEVVYCTVCNAELSRETKTIDKLAHTPAGAVKENEVPASCTAEGSYDEVVYCSVCSTELGREIKTVDKLAHTPAEAVKENETPATCTMEGSYDEVVYCSVCSAELSREAKTIDKLAHAPAEAVKENEVPTTCTVNGSYEAVIYCASCGQPLSREAKTVPALGHSYALAEQVPASYGIGGYELYRCIRCGSSYTVTYDALTLAAPKQKKPAAGKKKLTAKFTPVAGADGYQLQYCTKKKFTKKARKTKTIKKGTASKKTVKKLKKGKVYYVRIRAFKTVNGKKLYSAWSKVKKVKVK